MKGDGGLHCRWHGADRHSRSYKPCDGQIARGTSIGGARNDQREHLQLHRALPTPWARTLVLQETSSVGHSSISMAELSNAPCAWHGRLAHQASQNNLLCYRDQRLGRSSMTVVPTAPWCEDWARQRTLCPVTSPLQAKISR